jgi:protein-tyrosine-phosphatase
MAEGLLRKYAGGKDLETFSAGTGALSGLPASDFAIKVMNEVGVDISGHESRTLDGFMLEEADRVFVMTEGHVGYITSWFKSVAEKVELLRIYDSEKEDTHYPNVPDPIGGTVDEYRKVREILERAIIGMEKEL